MSEGDGFRVLIADDHPLVVGGLRQAVLAAAPKAEIAVANDFDSMVAALEASPDTDLVLLDLAMPGVRGFWIPIPAFGASLDPGRRRFWQ